MKRLLLYYLSLNAMFTSCEGNVKYVTIDGFTMGTTYHIVYEGNIVDTSGINATLRQVNNSLSVYNEQSVISKINRNETMLVDSFFILVFTRSYEIYKATGGAFDISASPLFNAWNFGYDNKVTTIPDVQKIDSLMQFCGMQHVWLEDRQIHKSNPRVTLNANAIAKGFGVDAVACFLEHLGINNYVVEIGGEVRCNGKNRHGKAWRIGIDKPDDGNILPGQTLQSILHLQNKSLATSGNYRKYYESGGKKYTHIINPTTGFPALNNLLSATVIADDCMTADAYATAIMVMGLDSAKQLVAKHPELDVFLLYDDNGKLNSFYTDNIKKMLIEYSK